MTEPSRRPGNHEVTWDASRDEAVAVSRQERQATDVVDEFDMGGFLFSFAADPNTLATPGQNLYIFDLQVLQLFGVGTVWTVAASATEIQPPNTPYIGDAQFLTNGVEFNQPQQRAFVNFYVDWPPFEDQHPLPVGIMMTIGWRPK